MKKGFTLIELLAVITLLGILLTLLIPNINASIKSSRQKALDLQINEIKKAAEIYINEQGDVSVDTPTLVSIQTLKQGGYLDNVDIINPLTNRQINGCIKFTFNETYNNYDKEYVETCE